MKRSTKLKLALLAATALTIAACGEAKEEVLAYKSVDECIKALVRDTATCEKEFAKAKEVHERTAPRYANSRSCNADFGYDRCYQHQTGTGSVWLPFMMGYMLAPRGRSTVYTQPLYRPRDDPNYWYTGRNGRIASTAPNGRATLERVWTDSPPKARTRTVSRGGFGKRSVSSSS